MIPLFRERHPFMERLDKNNFLAFGEMNVVCIGALLFYSVPLEWIRGSFIGEAMALNKYVFLLQATAIG
jgi:hypothetical protein